MERTGPEREDCTCPICLDIMVEPVTMPCKHSLCMPCYKQTVEKSSLCCPICRLRISVWARKASKSNTLVDRRKWEAIKKAYPEKVRSRLEGKEGTDDDSESDLDDYETQLRKLKELSKPGEIRQEYEAAIEKLQRQREEEAKKEEEASAALIRALQEEEEQELELLEKQREESERLGRIAAEQLQQENWDFGLGGSLSPTVDHRSKSDASVSLGAGSRADGKTGKKSKSKQTNRPTSANLTLNSFFSATPRSVSNDSAGNQAAQGPQSPYPYPCISPKDKIFYGLSPQTRVSVNRSNSSSSDEAPGWTEHSYTTASAKRIDLTNSESERLTLPRKDVKSYDLSRVKSEPEDIFSPGPSGIASNSHEDTETLSDCVVDSYSAGCSGTDRYIVQFKPISSCHRTPPKKLANGSVHDPPLVKTIPRNFHADFSNVPSSSSSSVLKIGAIQTSPTVSSVLRTTGSTTSAVVSEITTLPFVPHVQSKGKSLENGRGKGPKSSLNVANRTATIAAGVTSSPRIHIISIPAKDLHSGGTYKVNSITTLMKENTNLLKPKESDGTTLKSNTVLSTKGDNNIAQVVPELSSIVRVQNGRVAETVQNMPSSKSGELVKRTEKPSLNKETGCQIVYEILDEDDDACTVHESTTMSKKEGLPASSSICAGTFSNNPTKHSGDIDDKSDDVEILGDDNDSNDNNNKKNEMSENSGKQCDNSVSLCNVVVERPVSKNKDKRPHLSPDELSASSDEENGKEMARVLENMVPPAINVSDIKPEQPLQVSKSQNVESEQDSSQNSSNSQPAVKKEISHISSKHQGDSVKGSRKTKPKDSAPHRRKTLKNKEKSSYTLDFFIKKQQRTTSSSNGTVVTGGGNDREVCEDENFKDDSLSKKRGNSDIDDDVICLDDVDTTNMTQEEKDHLVALRLQELYSKFDKQNIVVDRFKGAKDQYSLRKKRKLK